MQFLRKDLNSFPAAFPVGLFSINHHVSCLCCQVTFCTGPLSALIHNRLFLVVVFSPGDCCYFPISFRLLTTQFFAAYRSGPLTATRGYPHFLSFTPSHLQSKKWKIPLVLSYPSYFVSTDRTSFFKVSSN